MPAHATPLINIYRTPSELYMHGNIILSQEWTIQGDPLAMPMYALATIPLIKNLKSKIPEVNQVWYADDSLGSGEISKLRDWWDHLSTIGPNYGYYTNSSKTWLLTKKDYYLKADAAFRGTGVCIITNGRPHLGLPIRTEEYNSIIFYQ